MPPRGKAKAEAGAALLRESAERRQLAKTASKQAQTLLQKRERERAKQIAEEKQRSKNNAAQVAKEIRKFWQACSEVVYHENQQMLRESNRKKSEKDMEAMLMRTEVLSKEVSAEMSRGLAAEAASEDEDMGEGSEDAEEEEEREGDELIEPDGECKGNQSDARGPNREIAPGTPQEKRTGTIQFSKRFVPEIDAVDTQGPVEGPSDVAKQEQLDQPSGGSEAQEAMLQGGTPEKMSAAAMELGREVAFDLHRPTLHTTTMVPALLRRPIRDYQHVGLHWLATLHDKGFNGILADEMGLGKTVMTIALIAHLAVEKMVWGQHLVVVPSSVLLTWDMEFKRWAPGLKVLTYYGSKEERQKKRIGWASETSFDVCLVSYAVVLQDVQIFRRRKWYYLILDEAQNIKNFKSKKWQELVRLTTVRRLLLTGTPLQNDVMELWALLHFLMPTVFDTYVGFRDWFSEPLRQAAEAQQMEKEQAVVTRLHSVLRPFMLRRLKKEVEKQLPAKHEHLVSCALSRRQQVLYDEFLRRRETQKILKSGDYLGMMNILMQLRKVCNHPELFEMRRAKSPFSMEPLQMKVPSLVLMRLWRAVGRGGFKRGDWGFSFWLTPLLTLWLDEARLLKASEGTMMVLQGRPAIDKMARTSMPAAAGKGSLEASRAFALQAQPSDTAPPPAEEEHAAKRRKLSGSTLMRGGKQAQASLTISTLEKVGRQQITVDLPGEVSRDQRIVFIPVQEQPQVRIKTRAEHRREVSGAEAHIPEDAAGCKGDPPDVDGDAKSSTQPEFALLGRPLWGADGFDLLRSMTPSEAMARRWRALGASAVMEGDGRVLESLKEHVHTELQDSLSSLVTLVPKVSTVARPSVPFVQEAVRDRRAASRNQALAIPLTHGELRPLSGHVPSHASLVATRWTRESKPLWRSWQHEERVVRRAFASVPSVWTPPVDRCMELARRGMTVQFPEKHYLQSDSGKLERLAVMLRDFHREGCKCIIFTQFTSMLDVLEAWVCHRRYTYLRLDGSVKVEQRQSLVDHFNEDDKVFLFLASTRAGGVGITLTGANVVIFYDSDWNPSMDRQATDRAHRIGQVREVHIHRLISAHTVEENIWRKQVQKRILDDAVVDQGKFTPEALQQGFSDLDVRSILALGDAKAHAADTRRTLPSSGKGPAAAASSFEKALLAVEDPVDLQLSLQEEQLDQQDKSLAGLPDAHDELGEQPEQETVAPGSARQLPPLVGYGVRLIRCCGIPQAMWTMRARVGAGKAAVSSHGVGVGKGELQDMLQR